jgi:hypothetical protein
MQISLLSGDISALVRLSVHDREAAALQVAIARRPVQRRRGFMSSTASMACCMPAPTASLLSLAATAAAAMFAERSAAVCLTG